MVIANDKDGLLKVFNEGKPIDKLFILCHGNETGQMIIGKDKYSYKELCKIQCFRRQPDNFIFLPIVHCYAHRLNLDSNTKNLLRQLDFQAIPKTSSESFKDVTYNVPLDDDGNIEFDTIKKCAHSGLNPEILTNKNFEKLKDKNYVNLE